MNPFQTTVLFFVLLSLLALPGQGQTLIADFEAPEYAGGSTWTDDEGNLTANYVGSTAAVANGTSVTTNGGFSFSTGNLSGFNGSGSYTVAVGFNAVTINSSGGPYAFEGDGIFGADINGYGKGDIGLSLSSYQGGSILAGGGDQNGGDDTVSGPEASGGNSSPGSFSLKQVTGAVLVVQANTAGQGNPANGSMSLYVNGVRVGQTTGLNPQVVGFDGNRFNYSVDSYDFGLGVMSSVSAFNGSITLEQIYNGALGDMAAESLSQGIEDGTVPEPRASVLLLISAGVLALGQVRRIRA